MSLWIDMSPDQQLSWQEWLAKQSDSVRKLVIDHDLRLDRLYYLKSIDKRVIIRNILEDRSISVAVLQQFNKDSIDSVLSERVVYGVKAEDLVECDYSPASEEKLTLSLYNEWVRTTTIDDLIEIYKLRQTSKAEAFRESRELTIKERIDLAVCVYGLYTISLTWSNCKTDSEKTDVICALDNTGVPFHTEQLTCSDLKWLIDISQATNLLLLG